MNETLKTILTRRSVRSFQSRKIERPDLELILKAATYAPSGMNRQTWQFTAVTDRDEIRKLAKLIEVEMDREGYDFYDPAVLIIPSNERDSRWGPEDNVVFGDRLRMDQSGPRSMRPAGSQGLAEKMGDTGQSCGLRDCRSGLSD